MKNTSMDGAMRRALASHRDQPVGPCPDENIIAAYLEMRLDQSEKKSVESHASDCAACQERMGLALRLSEPSAELDAAEAASSSGKRVLFHISLPVSVLAMIVLTLAAGYLLFRVLRESTPIQTAPHIAELRSPVKAEGISAAKSQVVSLPKEKAALIGPQTHASTPESQRSKARLAPKVTPPPPATELALVAEPAPQPPQALVPTPPTTAQVLEAKAEGGAADKSAVIATNLSENRPAIAGAASPGAARMNLAAANQESALRAQSVAQFSPEATPRDAVQNLARLAPSGRNMLLERKLKDRTFYFNSGYWIDSQCAENPSAEYVYPKHGSAEQEQILKSFPEADKIRPVVVFWNGKNCVLR